MTRKLHALEAEIAKMRTPADGWAAQLAALDKTIALLHPRANPAAGGSINAWAGRYGKRGGLTTFVREHLKSIFPQSLSCSEVRVLVTERFGLVLFTKKERIRHRSSVDRLLRRLRDRDGVIEKVDGNSGQPRWCWKQAETLEDLWRRVERL
jgi:hypothetical protein